MVNQREQLFKSLILMVDLLFISLSWWLAYWLRFDLGLFPKPEPYKFDDYLLAWFCILLIWGPVLGFFNVCQPLLGPRQRTENLRILQASFVAVSVFLGLIFLLKYIVLSRTVVVLFAMASIVALRLSHVLFRCALEWMTRSGYYVRKTLIIGTAAQVQDLVHKFQSQWNFGSRILGIHLAKTKTGHCSFSGVPLLCMREALELVRAGTIDDVFITLPCEESEMLHEIRGVLSGEAANIYFVPDFSDIFTLRGKVAYFDGTPIVTLQDSPLYGWNALSKRSIDLIVGGVLVVCLFPLMLIVALVIRLTSSGPFLFRQERMGLDGRKFLMLKFRTMMQNAEETTGPIWATANDPRVTPVGRILRRSSLDELPQLFNVVKGEMSLVGPRPERPELIEGFRHKIPEYMLRHKVKGGITGWAQVHGWRGNTSLEERIHHDIYYIKNWSIWLDFKILCMSLLAVLSHRNAY